MPPDEETRAEHLAWCKQRALEYVELDNLPQAAASMTSDLRKHSETADVASATARSGLEAVLDGKEAVRRWIEGIN